jgi:RNase P/RNase MRP subunit p29
LEVKKDMTNELAQKNLIQHEFVGLHVTVIDSPDKSLVARSGVIIDETMNTFKLEIEQIPQNRIPNQKKIIIVPKHKTRFQFTLPINSTEKHVELDGSILTKRPEDRIKKLAKLANKIKKGQNW